MARCDHIAYRTKSRWDTANFFIKAFGYKLQKEFKIEFDDGSYADCIALEPPEKTCEVYPWFVRHIERPASHLGQEYHLAPEIFISDGPPDSIVGKWVDENGSGIHHIAYMVESVEKTMKEWKDNGFAEFSSDKPLKCPEDNLIQIFTKENPHTGIVYELIQRGEHGFCTANVKNLMLSTQNS